MFAFALWDARHGRPLRRARSPRRQAVPLRLRWRDARVRLGVEGGARAPGGRKRNRPRGAAALSRMPVHSGSVLGASPASASCRPATRSRSRRARSTFALLAAGLFRQAACSTSARPRTALDRELRASVEGMLVADVPLGAFVSGGVDSGLVAAMMTDLTGGADRHVQPRVRGRRRESASTREAARVAAHLGSRHHALMLSPDHVLDAFDRWIDVFDEPFADQAALPTMLLAGFARRDVTVVLTGEGADEVFGGYSNYRKRVREERADALARASGFAAAGDRQGAAGRAAQGPAAALADRAASAPVPDDSQCIRRAAASVAAHAAVPGRDARRARRRRLAAAAFDEAHSAPLPRPPAARRHQALATRRSA